MTLKINMGMVYFYVLNPQFSTKSHNPLQLVFLISFLKNSVTLLNKQISNLKVVIAITILLFNK